MSEAVETMLTEVANIVKTVPGLEKSVYFEPPETISDAQFAVVYEDTWRIEATPTGTRRGMYNVAVDVLTRRVDLARDFHRLRPFVDTVSLALLRQMSFDSDGNPGQQFNHSMETFGSLGGSRINNVDYGGVPVIGYHILLNDVKILVNL